MKEHDLAHARPWLLASLFFGISYIFLKSSAMLGGFAILWKGACVSLLIPYVLRWRAVADRPLLAIMLGLYAMGDMLIEIDLLWGAFLFVCGHISAICYFWRQRRHAPAQSQLILAMVIPIASLVIAFFAVPGAAQEPLPLVYVGFVSIMAGSAWYSRFPRYRTGIGALLFLASGFLIIAREGGLLPGSITGWLVWPLYYAGIFMMATGIVQRSRATAIDGDAEFAL